MVYQEQATTDPENFISHCRREADLERIANWRRADNRTLEYEYREMYYEEWLRGWCYHNTKQARRMVGAILLSRGVTEVETKYGQLVMVSTLDEIPPRKEKPASPLVEQVARYLLDSGVKLTEGGSVGDIALIELFLETYCGLPKDRDYFDFCYAVCSEMLRISS